MLHDPNLISAIFSKDEFLLPGSCLITFISSQTSFTQQCIFLGNLGPLTRYLHTRPPTATVEL
ncbi:hypothetical protein SLEP1_g38369 [Rubroshorea leprosula]|nr:hypothetical protein SLEP1_g38369 [Rubroshorea leprosula]